MMRVLAGVAILGAIVWAVFRFVSPEQRHEFFAALGADVFLEKTMPDYFRSKFTIVKNPTAERKELIHAVSRNLDEMKKKLSTVTLPKSTDPAVGKVAAEISALNDLVAKTSDAASALGAVNAEDGAVHNATARIVDALLPAPKEAVCPAK